MEDNKVSEFLSDLVTSCTEFALRHPSIGDPQHLVSVGSFLYADLFYLEMSKINLDVRVLHLQGHRNFLKNRHNAFYRQSNPSPNFYHCVCLVNNSFVVDPAARLLDTKGQKIRIFTPADLNKEWLMIGSSFDAIEAFNNIGIFLKQATIRWQKEEFPDRTPTDIEKSMEEYRKLAIVFYNQTISNVTLNHLVFTETQEQDNIHIDVLNQEWRPLLETM